MTLDKLFIIANLTATFGWACLAISPVWRRGCQAIAGTMIPLLLSLAYVLLLWPSLLFGAGTDGGAAGLSTGTEPGFTTLDGVIALFSDRRAFLIGWIHYLAFDLFVGAWAVRDANQRGIPHLWVLPCLVLTFMFGPTGLLLYFIIRTIRQRRVGELA